MAAYTTYCVYAVVGCNKNIVTMNEAIDFIKNNIFNIASTIFGLIGVFLALFIYFKTKKTKKPLYSVLSIQLLNAELKKIENIDIKYLGESIKNLTASKIAFWNGGKDTIDKYDLPENNKFKISGRENIIIYSAELENVIDESNQIQIKLDNNEVSISFDYLDFCQGGIIKVLHSGDKSSDLIISGEVKSAGNIKEADEKPNEEDYPFMIFFVFIISLAFISGGIIAVHLVLKIILISLGLFFFYVLYILTIGYTRIPKSVRKIMKK